MKRFFFLLLFIIFINYSELLASPKISLTVSMKKGKKAPAGWEKMMFPEVKKSENSEEKQASTLSQEELSTQNSLKSKEIEPKLRKERVPKRVLTKKQVDKMQESNVTKANEELSNFKEEDLKKDEIAADKEKEESHDDEKDLKKETVAKDSDKKMLKKESSAESDSVKHNSDSGKEKVIDFTGQETQNKELLKNIRKARKKGFLR